MAFPSLPYHATIECPSGKADSCPFRLASLLQGSPQMASLTAPGLRLSEWGNCIAGNQRLVSEQHRRGTYFENDESKDQVVSTFESCWKNVPARLNCHKGK